MILGILSDTHGSGTAASAAVRVLQEAGAEYLIHCGDVGSEGVLDHLAGIPSAFVFGNVDFDRPGLARYAQSLEIRCLDDFGELELGGKRLAVTHGDNARLVARILRQQDHDYLLLGHTHLRRDERAGRIRIINPGALHRARVKTVAVLETDGDRLEFLQVSA